VTNDGVRLLADLPGMAFGFVLVLSRVAAALMMLPGFGEAELPTTIRAALAVLLAALLLPVVQPMLPPIPPTPGGTLALVAEECLVGLWLGWLARLVVLALPLAGQVVASMLGLTNVVQPDVTLGPQTSSLSKLFGLAAPVLIFATGLYRLPLIALSGSYELIAPGAVLPAGDLATTVIRTLVDCFALALQLSGPFVLAGIVWQVSLGIVARLVPQLQVYFAAMPGQIIGGLVLLAALSAAVLDEWQAAASASFNLLPGL
jgi:flagellar biosynthetic protein FliR